jgi:hypothetical protein
MSEKPQHGGENRARAEDLREWVRLQRTVLPIDTAIDQIRSRCHAASDTDKVVLEPELYSLLMEAGRRDEALQTLDAAIAQRPGEVLSPTGWQFYYHNDRDDELGLIDFALVRARSSGTWVRYILGSKAWLLLFLRRGDELGQVLEQIMAHKVRRDVPDVGRERYFIDASPRGLIPADIRARYDVFCPKRAGDVPFPPPEFESPEWGPDGNEMPAMHPRAEAIDRTETGEPGPSRPRFKTTVSADEIDRIIFSRLPTHGTWRKTAAVVGWVAQQCEDEQRAIADYEIFQRILQLVTDGALEAQGNLSLWRYSEVRPVQNSSAR